VIRSTRYTPLGSLTRRTYPRCVAHHLPADANANFLIYSGTQDDTQDPHPLPPRGSDESLLQAAISQATWLFENDVLAKDTCALCSATLQIGKFLSLAAPEQASTYFVFLCERFGFSGNCTTAFGPRTFGPVLAQVLANADVVGYDGQVRRACQWVLERALSLRRWSDI
jgi:hypothetical protein